jgi:hypothetical protein
MGGRLEFKSGIYDYSPLVVRSIETGFGIDENQSNADNDCLEPHKFQLLVTTDDNLQSLRKLSSKFQPFSKSEFLPICLAFP